MTAIPTGNVFLSLFWGSGGYTTQRPNSPEQTAMGGVFISGQQFEVAHHWVKRGEVNVIGFEMTPNAIHQFFGVPQQETTGKVLALKDVWSNKASLLYHQVINEPNTVRQIQIVEEFLCKRILAKEWQYNPTVAEATYTINLSKGNISVQGLASKLGISTRSLERKFLEAVGTSPKAFCKIMQFNNAFRQLTLPHKQILDVVSDAGYYDQPHFINHFRKVLGKSPGQFFEEHENFLYSFRKDNNDCTLDSMSDTLNAIRKLYVF
ncbi:AraC family transcriptional regulator [Flammeovirgaceae bacterium 311]|nr:AraC family transcriptional regulator [Flammeovirgaceae bacterium 311]